MKPYNEVNYEKADPAEVAAYWDFAISSESPEVMEAIEQASQEN